MKTFSRPIGVVLLAILALQGCSTNPSVSGGGSIEDFARNLDGKFQNLDARGTGQRIPQGLLLLLKPATEHCSHGGGFATLKGVQDRGEVSLPAYLLCQRGPAQIWALGITYVGEIGEFQNDAAGKPVLLRVKSTMGINVLSADQAEAVLQAEKLQEEEKRRADAPRVEREAALERERQQRAKDKDAEAQRVAAQWPSKVATFQANLKVGDRFQWGRAPIWGGPFVGMVVKVEGALAFVQFDNLTFAGQQTRYLPKAELEPFDGPTPALRGTIN